MAEDIYSSVPNFVLYSREIYCLEIKAIISMTFIRLFVKHFAMSIALPSNLILFKRIAQKFCFYIENSMDEHLSRNQSTQTNITFCHIEIDISGIWNPYSII